MTTATISQGIARGLPPALRAAQAAIQLSEVQEMLRRLSEHGLGICVPHMHDEQTGEFQLLAEELMQVESGLEVSFQSTAKIAKHSDRFLPMAWVWRDGAQVPSAVCEMVQTDGPGDEEERVKHKCQRGTDSFQATGRFHGTGNGSLRMTPTKETR